MPISNGTVIVTDPLAPATKVVKPQSGTVHTSPGVAGPPGAGVQLAGAVPTYADLPTDLTVTDTGEAYMVNSNGRLYVWDGTAFPLEANGAPFKGDKGDPGRGVNDITINGADLSFAMSDNSTDTVTVPEITAAQTAATNAANSATAASTSATNAANSATAASTSATNAANSASDADADRLAAAGHVATAAGHATDAGTARTGAESARDAAMTAQGLAEGARNDASGHATNAANSAAAAAQSAQDAADVVSSGIPNAGPGVKGGVMLPGSVPGELGGTYTNPTVTGWSDVPLLVGGKIPASYLPPIALVSTQVVADTVARLALTAETGDIAVQTGNPGRGTYILRGSNPAVAGDWELLVAPTDAVSSVNGYQGIVVLGKADIGLANVDNTSDADKPVSTATQTALSGKANATHNHAAGDINSGTLSIARIPTGQTGTTVPLGNDPRFTDARTPLTHNHAAGDINSGTLAYARLPVGTTANTVAAGNDARLSDTRTPTAGSVNNASVAAGAGIELSKLATGRVAANKNGVATSVTLWFGTEAQYNTATSNGTAEDPNTVYFRSA